MSCDNHDKPQVDQTIKKVQNILKGQYSLPDQSWRFPGVPPYVKTQHLHNIQYNFLKSPYHCK